MYGLVDQVEVSEVVAEVLLLVGVMVVSRIDPNQIPQLL